MALNSKNRKELTDLTNPVQMAELNKQLSWLWTQLLGGLTAKALDGKTKAYFESRVGQEEMDKYTTIDQTAEAIAMTAEALEGQVSEVRQTADKINWLVLSGDSAANMALTDRLFQLVAENIDLTGKVTFNSLDNETRNTINGAVSTASGAASTANSAYNTAAGLQNGLAWGTTTIDGGCIRTGLIDARYINTAGLSVGRISDSNSPNLNYVSVSSGGLNFIFGGANSGHISGTASYIDMSANGNMFINSGGGSGIYLKTDGETWGMEIGGTHPYSGARAIIVSNHMIPERGDAYDLGGDGNNMRWRRLYTNNSVSVSDRRAKKDISALNAADLLKRLKPVRYRLSEEGDKAKLRFGLVAQEVIEAIRGTDYADANLVLDDNPDHLGLCYQELIAVLIEGHQRHEARIAALEGELNTLKAQLTVSEGSEK